MAGARRRAAAQKKRPPTRYPTLPVVVRVDVTSAANPNFDVAATYQVVAVPQSGLVPFDTALAQIPISGRTITYESSNAAVATVSAGGLVTGQGGGTCTITAVCESIRVGTNNPVTCTITTPQNAVASVSVTPTTGAGDDGGTQLVFNATVLDASANILTGKTVTWSEVSGGSLITTGADSGDEAHAVTVTCNAAGTATIKATCSGVDSNVVTITVGASGSTIYWQDDFSTGGKGPSQNGFAWGIMNATANSELPVVTSVNPYPGSGYSLQFGFGASGSGDSNSEQRFIFGTGLTEFYFRWYVWYPGASDGALGTAKYIQQDQSGSDNNKFIIFYEGVHGDSDNVSSFEIDRKTNNDSSLTCKHTYRKADGSKIGNGTNGEVHSFPTIINDANRGRWLKFQIYTKIGTMSAPGDGIQRVWLDDVMIVNETAISLYSPFIGAGNQFNNGYILGWCNAGFAEYTRVWVGPVKMASAYITD